jgi:ABC-2 type transport system permease protein
MRFDMAWIIVRKEFSEYRVNRYILYTLVFMPLILAIVMPIIYVVPISSTITPGTAQPLDLNLVITHNITGISVENQTLSGYRFVDSDLKNVVTIGCVFERCNLTFATVQSSEIHQSLVIESTVAGSNIYDSTTINSALPGSVFPGQENPDLAILKYLVDSITVFFVLIPVVIPTVIASYSIVGEKLNKSLEPLLATPATDTELLAGKSLAIFIPSMLITWAALIPAILIVDLVTQPLFGYYLLPNLTMIVSVFILAPLFCFLSIMANVIVSARVTDVRSSQQIGSLVVLPVVLFFILAIAGILTPGLMLIVAVALVGIDLVIFSVSLRVFRREEILVKWK